VGKEAQARREILSLTYPIKRGHVRNWDEWEKFLEYVADWDLPDSVAFTEHLHVPIEETVKKMEIIFEKFQEYNFAVFPSSVLSAYALGRTTACVVEMGDGKDYSFPTLFFIVLIHLFLLGVTTVAPLFEGYFKLAAVQQLDFGGSDITKHLIRQIMLRGNIFTVIFQLFLFFIIIHLFIYLFIQRQPADQFGRFQRRQADRYRHQGRSVHIVPCHLQQ